MGGSKVRTMIEGCCIDPKDLGSCLAIKKASEIFHIRDTQPMSYLYNLKKFQTKVNTGGHSKRLMSVFGKL